MSNSTLAPVRLHLTATVDSPIYLPNYAGSTLRGAFGHALRALACTTRAPDCVDCSLASTCPFPAVFAPRLADNQMALNDETPPYVVEPYVELALNDSANNTEAGVVDYLPRELPIGANFKFAMVVWGAGRSQLPLIIMAWQRALARGIGLRPKVQLSVDASDDDAAELPPTRIAMGCATLIQIDAVPENAAALPLWSIDAPKLNHQSLISAEFNIAHINNPPAWLENGCSLHLYSPLRIAQQGGVLTGRQINAMAVLQAMLRRCQQAGVLNDAIIANLPRIDETAASLKFQTRVSWWDARRYSSTQQQTTPLGGLIGLLDFSGDMRPYWALLYAAQWLHMGKESVFGLGGYTVLPHFNH